MLDFKQDSITQKIIIKKNGLLVDRELRQINFIARNSLKFYFHLVLQKEFSSDNNSYDKVEHQNFFRLELLNFYKKFINEPLKYLSILNLTELTNFFLVKNKTKDFYYTFLNKKKNIFNLIEVNEIFNFLNIIPLNVNISNVNDFINLKKYNINIQKYNKGIPMLNKNILLKQIFGSYKFRLQNYEYLNKIKTFNKNLKKKLIIRRHLKKQYLKLLLERSLFTKELKNFQGLSLNSIYTLKLLKLRINDIRSRSILYFLKLKNKNENYFNNKIPYYWLTQLKILRKVIKNKKKKLIIFYPHLIIIIRLKKRKKIYLKIF